MVSSSSIYITYETTEPTLKSRISQAYTKESHDRILHILLLSRAMFPVMVEIVFASESLVARVARMYDPEVPFLNMPREVLCIELLVAILPSTMDARLVCSPNSMVFTEVSRKFMGKKWVVAA
jgi:hypothetical protein